ncbi:hypothetical protein FVE88_15515 [Ectopseudomonas mendocina]|uniref:Uncharacterized protein n=1 Tax=Ectopseudomonas oleovorans TaxID=301 RepID=A0A3R8WFW3_ECTOL|nr:hypothetical protein EGJ44_03245 [Pseudomonas oleovorans]TXR38227.1 hypothetical protein FVE88_15515 [Pseudomonas mendocina]
MKSFFTSPFPLAGEGPGERARDFTQPSPALRAPSPLKGEEYLAPLSRLRERGWGRGLRHAPAPPSPAPSGHPLP